MSVREAKAFVEKLKFTGSDEVIARDIIPEIAQRLHFMEEVGLSYLQLDRSATTLSGGESQRIRLAAQLGSNLRGVLYVLDEPTIGLHPRDNAALLDTLGNLKKKGNSLVVVEHDEETITRSDYVIDLGPGAGEEGGEIVWRGKPGDLGKLSKAKAENLPPPACFPSNSVIPQRETPHPSRRGQQGRLDQDRGRPGQQPEKHQCPGSDRKTHRDRRNQRQRQEQFHARRVFAPRSNRSSRKDARTTSRSEKTWKSIKGADMIEAIYEVDQSPIGKRAEAPRRPT